MKIQSKYKDYYDFITFRFGGDPDIVYARSPLKITDIMYNARGFFADVINYEYRRDHHITFIVAGSYVIPLINHWEKKIDISTNEVSHTLIAEILEEKHYHLLMKGYKSTKPIGLPKFPVGDKLNDVIRLVGQPVFLINKVEHDRLLLSDRIPILKDYGIASLITPQEMWQNIYTCLTNVLRKNPDKEPPVEVAEKYKIHAAGFDLKTSFRHPVNKKVK